LTGNPIRLSLSHFYGCSVANELSNIVPIHAILMARIYLNPLPESTHAITETHYTSQNQLNDEIKYNSIKLQELRWNNLFESIKLANVFWSQVFSSISINSSLKFFSKLLIAGLSISNMSNANI
jgi:hypothetical protein